jgi:hypothetical protein
VSGPDELLANAIVAAAIKAGMIDGGSGLTGPHLVMLCDNLGTQAAANAALAARCGEARTDALEEAAKLCDAIDRNACEWIKRNPDDLGDAYKHTDGVSDGADACATAIRSLASQAEGDRG